MNGGGGGGEGGANMPWEAVAEEAQSPRRCHYHLPSPSRYSAVRAPHPPRPSQAHSDPMSPAPKVENAGARRVGLRPGAEGASSLAINNKSRTREPCASLRSRPCF